MEGGKMRALVVVVLVMGMLVGQSSAGFKGCYAKCFMFCMIKPPHSVMLCGGKCLKHCIIPAPTAQPTIQPTGHDFCKLGCASTSCANISTQADPVEEKVESCVGSCSELCSKNYLSP